MNEPEILEDYLEGYRAWRVVNNRLYSLLKAGEYPRGVATAECNKISRHGKTESLRPFNMHEAPNRECNCGLYATWDKISATTSELIGISGKVKGWGKSMLASKGWRSQYQMIEYLYNPLCQACCSEYRYEVRDSSEIFQATRKLKFNIEFEYLDKDIVHESVIKTNSLGLDEYLCKTHFKSIADHDIPLIKMMMIGPNSPLELEIVNIDVKRAITNNKYMKGLKDLSNYYEVDFKDFNNENN